MDDQNDPYSRENLSWNWSYGGPTWRPFRGRRGPRVPPPPWARNQQEQDKAEREQQRRADARADRLHLVGLTGAAAIIIGVLACAMVVMVAVLLVIRH